MKNNHVSLFGLLIMIMFPLAGYGWWDTGHMAIAAIAYQHLNPETRVWVDELVEELDKHYPDTQTFIECSTWADDLKKQGIYAYSSWHYTNIPYNPDSLALPQNAKPEVDVIWAINQARQVLTAEDAVSLEKARFLAFLVHFVGDLHQPLHSTSMYDDDVPEGNRGGNEFSLKSFKHRNLHMLWDDGCGYFDRWEEKGKLDRPLGRKGFVALEEMVSTIMIAHPESSLENLYSLEPTFWAMESHELAVNAVFMGTQYVTRSGENQLIQPGDSPSELYMETGREIVEKQLARAGYRLAMLLNEIHGNIKH
ncbi:MAG: S1/P1 nuclease [Bacteroidetes bacterium]|nr:S1/P1 nuclease [Bacteroidota bacterium]